MAVGRVGAEEKKSPGFYLGLWENGARQSKTCPFNLNRPTQSSSRPPRGAPEFGELWDTSRRRVASGRSISVRPCSYNHTSEHTLCLWNDRTLLVTRFLGFTIRRQNEAVRQRLLRVAVTASSIERVYPSYTDSPTSMKLRDTRSRCCHSRCMVEGIPTSISCRSCIYRRETRSR